MADREGWWTTVYPDGDIATVFEAATRYRRAQRSADRARRTRFRHRQQPRLGGEGSGAARRAGRHRAFVRAHPSLQPDRRRHRAAAVRRGRQRRHARPRRQRGIRLRGRRRRCRRSADRSRSRRGGRAATRCASTCAPTFAPTPKPTCCDAAACSRPRWSAWRRLAAALHFQRRRSDRCATSIL